MFEAIGLPIEGGIGGPLFRPLVNFESGQIANRGVTSAEVTAFLRVVDASPADEGCRISSHSLKRTPLSWAFKAGLSKERRSRLGRHACAVHGTDVIYSVDLNLPFVAEFEKILNWINSQTFCPYARRHEFWAFPPEPPCRLPSEPDVWGAIAPQSVAAQPLLEDFEGSHQASPVKEDPGSEASSSSSSSSSELSETPAWRVSRTRVQILASSGSNIASQAFCTKASGPICLHRESRRNPNINRFQGSAAAYLDPSMYLY